jgi:hypothetical protein
LIDTSGAELGCLGDTGRMSFRWRYLDGSGSPVDGPDEEFDDQAEAETWFSDEWPQLRERGIDAVDLLDGDEPVYGPMSLQDGA